MPGKFPFDTSNAKCVRERNRTANQLRPDRKPVARNSASQDRLGGSVNKRRFGLLFRLGGRGRQGIRASVARSEEHTSELQSLMRISYAVFCLKKKKKTR